MNAKQLISSSIADLSKVLAVIDLRKQSTNSNEEKLMLDETANCVVGVIAKIEAADNQLETGLATVYSNIRSIEDQLLQRENTSSESCRY